MQHKDLDFSDAPEFGRREGIERALRLLHDRRSVEHVVIVETGTTRGDLGGGIKGDGWATLAWGWYCGKYGGIAHTIDINPVAIENCKRITAPFSDRIVYHLGESCPEIRKIAGHIDLLYLDSGDDPALTLLELDAAFDKLAPTAIVMIDDTRMGGEHARGKGELACERLRAEGFRLVFGAEPSATPQVIFVRQPGRDVPAAGTPTRI